MTHRVRLLVRALEERTVPALITVTSIADSGAGSLRQAVLDSNATPGLDTIDFNMAAPGAINVTSGPLVVTDPLNIDGGNLAGRQITANNLNQIFVFSIAGAGAESWFNDLFLTKGTAAGDFVEGGAISLDDDALRLSRVQITNCVAGSGAAVGLVGGKLTVEDSIMTGNFNTYIYSKGGAITALSYSQTTPNRVIIRRSSFSNNKAWVGGAIYCNGGNPGGSSFTMEESTVYNNTANYSPGGGSLSTGDVGGVAAFAESVSVVQCTISGNTVIPYGPNDPATVGGLSVGNVFTTVNGGAIVSVVNCTITNNSAEKVGGVDIYGSNSTIVFSGNVVAQNNAPSLPDFSGLINTKSVSGGGNIIGSYSGPALPLTGQNLIGSPAAPINAKLGSLTTNGGPTLTHLPLPGSPVFNRGENVLGLTTDQRGSGFSRALNDAPDAGAIESAFQTPVAAGTTANVTVAGGNSQIVTVTYFDDTAIDVATLGTGDLVVNGPGGFTATPTFLGVDVNGNGTPRVATYSFTPPGGIWDGSDNGDYTVSQVATQVYDTASPTPNAAPVISVATFTTIIPRVIVVDHAIDESDGNTSAGQMSLREAVALANGGPSTPDTITFDPGVFASPTTIVHTIGQLKITDAVTIEGPIAPLTIDGALATRLFHISVPDRSGQPIILRRMILANGNMATSFGGAIYLEDESLTLDRMTIRDCKASSNGGGALASLGGQALTAIDCTFLNNVANNGSSSGAGGAMYIATSTSIAINLTRCLFAGNSASRSGGGVFVDAPMAKIVDCTFSGNSAMTGAGGAMYLTARTSALLQNCTISGNTATQGGGVYVRAYPVATTSIENCTIANNSASTKGGGLSHKSGAVVSATSSLVAANTSPTGPDVAGTLTANNCLIGNSSGTTITGSNNLLNLNPMLAPLAHDGGPTQTHRLLTGSPAINAGSNPALLAFDQRGAGFNRVIGSGPDIGAYEVQPPAKVAGIIINDGSSQRSRVNQITVTFDRAVTLPPNPADAFRIQRQSDNALVSLTAALGVNNSVTLTFSGPVTDSGSLADGRYTLTAFASLIATPDSQLDGNGDGIPGDDYVLVGDPATNRFFRLFGDADGDGSVAANDFIQFRLAFSGSDPIFDFDNDGAVAASDFIQFQLRFGGSL